MWYHFIGISGVSMKSIAKILELKGHKVTGSDLKLTGHKKENIKKEIDAVVYTSAVTETSPGWVEIEEANRLGIKLIKRGEMLAELVKDYKVIAVSGTHGKTTTTSMIGLTLIKAGLDPFILVGEDVPEIGGSFRLGKGEWAVVEACEYDRNFLYIRPEIAVVTNIEEEHLDHYPAGLPDLLLAFEKFLSQINAGGFAVICGDDENAKSVAEKINNPNIKKVFYGLDKSNHVNDLGFKLNLPGDHNRRNALATLAVAEILDIDKKIVESAIKDFTGAKRRFEIKGEKNGVIVIDDYGHHPTEIAALLSGAKEKYPDKNLVVIFWPHQYKRTQTLLKKFPAAFNLADKLIVKEIFFVPGRDKKLPVSGKDIVNLVNIENKNKARFIDRDDEILSYLNDNLTPNDLLITVGIPPVYKIGESFLGGR